MTIALKAALLIATTVCAAGAQAADWSDTWVGVRYGNRFTEPANPNKIRKAIVNVAHLSGDRLGTNFFNIDILASDGKDPPAGGGGGAQEFYGFYQRSYSLSALTDNKSGYGFAKDVLLVGRVDLGSKNTAFAPRPRKLRLGATVALPVTGGFFNVGAQLLKEANHNGIVGKNVDFKLAPVLAAGWSIPVTNGVVIGGFADVIGPKGKDGFGRETKTEILVRTTAMFDIAGPKSGIKAGIGLEYWKNKFGNNSAIVPGAKQTTGLLLTAYHF